MPSSASASDKSRQTSASKSFFGRKLHKEKPAVEDRYDRPGSGHGGFENLAPSANAAGSRSSRHSTRGSIQSLDWSHDIDYEGYSAPGAVVTSIPFDSLPSDTKSPIPVDSISKTETPSAQRDPSPNSFAITAAGDFHQYPAWNPSTVPQMQQSFSHPTGPRPPPHAPNMTMAGSSSGDRVPRYQQWGRPGSSATNIGFSHNSSSTLDSSANSRMSIDQASVHSSVSSNPRASGYFSSDSSSRTVKTSHSGDRNTLFSNGSGRSSAWQSLQQTTPAAPPDKYLTRPRDDRIVDQLFLELMQKRGWQNLPEQAKRQMVAYPASKKWTLVHQDRLTELQGEQKRRQNARQTYGHDYPQRVDDEGSPEWYVRKVMDDTITPKQLASLSVSLRTQPIR